MSLGDVTYPAHGDPPAHLFETYRCVNRMYTYECEWGSNIWTDHGSGAYSNITVGIYMYLGLQMKNANFVFVANV